MQRRANMQASSLIILLSILTILVQFISYYLFDSVLVIWLLAILVGSICCHILQQKTITFTSCFYYSVLNIFMSLIFIVMSYGNSNSPLPYTGTMLGIAMINWMVPAISGIVRHILEYGVKLEDYNDFFRNTSAVFILFYTCLFIYGSFWANAFPWFYQEIAAKANFLPFQIISTQIENYYLDGSTSLTTILTYLLPRVFLYIPYGFFVAILLRKYTLLYKLIAIISFPFVIELLQYFIINKRCDIDDFIYAIIGGILGSLVFFFINLLFNALTGKDFLGRESSFRYMSHLLHF